MSQQPQLTPEEQHKAELQQAYLKVALDENKDVEKIKDNYPLMRTRLSDYQIQIIPDVLISWYPAY